MESASGFTRSAVVTGAFLKGWSGLSRGRARETNVAKEGARKGGKRLRCLPMFANASVRVVAAEGEAEGGEGRGGKKGIAEEKDREKQT